MTPQQKGGRFAAVKTADAKTADAKTAPPDEEDLLQEMLEGLKEEDISLQRCKAVPVTRQSAYGAALKKRFIEGTGHFAGPTEFPVRYVTEGDKGGRLLRYFTLTGRRKGAKPRKIELPEGFCHFPTFIGLSQDGKRGLLPGCVVTDDGRGGFFHSSDSRTLFEVDLEKGGMIRRWKGGERQGNLTSAIWLDETRVIALYEKRIVVLELPPTGLAQEVAHAAVGGGYRVAAVRGGSLLIVNCRLNMRLFTWDGKRLRRAGTYKGKRIHYYGEKGKRVVLRKGVGLPWAEVPEAFKDPESEYFELVDLDEKLKRLLARDA